MRKSIFCFLMMSQHKCHCEVTNLSCEFLQSLVKNISSHLCLEIDKDNQESGGVLNIFTFLLISVFIFFFLFIHFSGRPSQILSPE